MNLFTRTFSKIFKSSNQQELDKIQNIIEAINNKENEIKSLTEADFCLLYTSPSPRDLSTSRMPSSA